MPDKDPSNYSLITYGWVMTLSFWGGFVGWIRKRREGVARPFNFTELVGELMTSGFAGVLTFLLCEWSNTPPLLTAALVGVSGHMGSRAIFHMEQWAEARFGEKRNEPVR